MKFVRILNLILAVIVTPFMVASAPADIEQAYKTEKAKVAQTINSKKAEKERLAQEKRAKAKEAKQKKMDAAKEKSANFKKAKVTATDKTAKTVKQVRTPKTPKTAKQPKIKAPAKKEKIAKTDLVAKKPASQGMKKDITPVESVTQRPANIRTLEPIMVTKGETFMIKRPASPNFGRTWKLHKPLPLQVEMLGEAKFVAAEHPGRNEGSMVYTFKGIKQGNVQIEFEKIYPPELRDKKPLKVRIVPVEIKE